MLGFVVFNYSCGILMIRDVRFWDSSAHAVDDIQQLLARRTLSITAYVLSDYFGIMFATPLLGI